MLADSFSLLEIGPPQGSDPSGFIATGERVLFDAKVGEYEHELWSSDGTPGRTQGFGRGDNVPSGIAIPLGRVGSRAIFVDHNDIVWSSDGTKANTVQLRQDQYIDSATSLGDRVLYVESDFSSHWRLISTDGTLAGTTVVKELNRRTTAVARLTGAGSLAYFIGWDDAHGYEWWETDGTSQGTRLLVDVAPGLEDFNSWVGPTAFGGDLYFVGETSTREGLWRLRAGASQATFVAPVVVGGLTVVNNTLLVQEWDRLLRLDPLTDSLVPIAALSQPKLDAEAQLDGFVYFVAHRDSEGYDLWKTNGIEVTPVAALGGDEYYDVMLSQEVIDGTLYFVAHTYGGAELWSTDGTSSGTVNVHPRSPGLSEIRAVGARLVFSGTGDEGQEPWVLNHDTGSANRLVDIQAGFVGSQSFPAFVGESLLAIGPAKDEQGYDFTAVWKADPATRQTTFTQAPIGINEIPGGLQSLGDRALVIADNEELWGIDANGNATSLQRLVAGPLLISGSLAYYQVERSLWRTDGTIAGTWRLATEVSAFGEDGDGLVFAGTWESQSGIFSTNGSLQGTRQLAPFGDWREVSQIVTAPGAPVYFKAYGIEDAKLYVVDRSGAEPQLLWVPPYWYFGDQLLMLGDQLLAAHGAGCFVSRGSPSNSTLFQWRVVSIEAFRTSSSRAFLKSESRLWATDGTEEGTYQLSSNLDYSGPFDAVVLDERLYYVSYHEGAPELWRTDGTPAGTERVSDLNFGEVPRRAGDLTSVDRQLFLNIYRYNDAVTLRYVPGYGSPQLVDYPVTLHDGQGRAYPVETGSGEQIRSALPGDVRGISLRFDEHVDVRSSDLSVVGSETGAYGIASFQYDAATFTARWTLNRPIDQPDQITLTLSDRVRDPNGTRLDGDWINPTSLDATRASVASGDWQEGGAFVFHFTVLPGDANRDNRVDGQDYQRWSDLFGTIGSGAIDEADFNGDGASSGDDYLLWADAFGTDFAVPAASVEAGARAAGETLAPRSSMGNEDARWTAPAHDQVLAAVWVAGELAEDSLGAPGVRRVGRSSLRPPGSGLAPVRERGL